MTIKPTALFAGANRHTASADWSSTHGLAFGSGDNIALWYPLDDHLLDPKTLNLQDGIHTLLRGHTEVVNAIRWLKHKGETYLVSGSADCTVRIWRRHEEEYDQVAELRHLASINTIATSQGSRVFAVGTADGVVRTWRLKTDPADGSHGTTEDSTTSDSHGTTEDSITSGSHGTTEDPITSGSGAEQLQTIDLTPRFLPLDIALSTLASGHVVMAVAGTSTQIHIFYGPDTDLTLGARLSGHEGWIRSLDFTFEAGPGSDMLLASASQDSYVRLWRFRRGEELPDLSTRAGLELELGAGDARLANKAHYIGGADKYSITFEALLIGHEDWIYTARWHTGTHGPRLLTASADNSLSMWSRDKESSLWESVVRLGEISATKGATSATGSTGGFWNGLWAPDGDEVVSLARTGAWRRWRFDATSGLWKQGAGVSGHVKDVKGIAWSTDGGYLLSTSSDQTTRLWAPWVRDGQESWHEMTRPQIHGYDLNCIASLGPRRFVSGADEKLLRVFDQPGQVAQLLSSVSGLGQQDDATLPDTANVPVLGLSNKAVSDEKGEDEDEDAAAHRPVMDTLRPPIEDLLARHTLWPEHEKLYGHGYEISAVATSHDHAVMATACKASSLEHAVIRLYETSTWRELKSLSAHSLTITGLGFSGDDEYLLSVGRDRQVAVFRRDEDKAYGRMQVEKAHSRMVLDCAWAPTAAGYVFATAGRDKTFRIWKLADRGFECVSTITRSAAVTAIAFETAMHDGRVRLAAGLEDGGISVLECDVRTCGVVGEVEIRGHLRPSGVVNQLVWRPAGHGSERLLAACSDDCSVRIYGVA